MVDTTHSDAATHGAAADHADGGDLARRRVLRQIVDLGCLPFGEEEMPQRGRLLALQQLCEAFALVAQTVIEWHRCRGLDAVDDCLRRELAPRFFRERGSNSVEDRGIEIGHGLLAASSWRNAAVEQFLDIGQRTRAQVALNDPVNETQRRGLPRRDRDTRGQEFEGRRHAGEARRPLRAAGAGQQAELDLGQPHPGRFECAAIVRCQRRLEATAERGAV